jgi:HEAT repeat protein
LIEESIGTVELFPEVWSALEDLTKPKLESRRNAIERLINLEAPYYSPLVTYLLATRITEGDLSLRARVVETLGNILSPKENIIPAPQDVRTSLQHYTSGFRTRQIFALLEVSAADNSMEDHVSRLIDACPYAGRHLIDILKDRKIPIDIRRQAARMIGKVGYLDALPALEKLEGRVEARLFGQKAMSFAPHEKPNEAKLLPAIRDALRVLRAP